MLETTATSRLTRITLISLLAFVAILSGCKTASTNEQPGPRGRQGSVPVAVSAAEKRDVPVYLSGLGTVTAYNTVTVKSRVDGQVVQIAFREGQDVRKGDLLVVVDPRPFQAALNQAEANLFRDQATLKDAQVNLGRYKDLFAAKVISQQQLDAQAAMVGQLEGAVRADEAQVQNARLQLNYTRITSPVDGRVGLKQVDIGNIVRASDATGLIVVTQLQPIAVVFTLPSNSLPTVAERMHKGRMVVDSYSQDDRTKLATGTLLTIDNQIDVTTGTARLKAIFDNKERLLWPNQFVNVRLLLETRKDSIVIPSAAVQRGPNGAFVYAVKQDKTVEIRPVTVAFSQGNETVVSQGINAGEVIVTDGQDRLKAGETRVEPRTGSGPEKQAGAV